jgi:hypothetical protein
VFCVEKAICLAWNKITVAQRLNKPQVIKKISRHPSDMRSPGKTTPTIGERGIMLQAKPSQAKPSQAKPSQ